tara:strand:+ start:2035 stop:3570 length:1536 start_codon:yes stop_codon:yes gene_type:complete
MPILKWLTREDDLKFSEKTSYRLLEEVPELSYGEKDSGNMIIQGDNLEALKSLLPFYAGQVKCIYIDPPYNTGSAFEHYDDNVEHSKWLSIMYPRLELLREFLSEDGSIWISIDADESHYLKVICDEIFGRSNFIDEVIWQRSYAPVNLKKTLSRSHDTILVYAKKFDSNFELNKLPRSDEANSRYKNPDNDPRGLWQSDNLSVGPAVEKNIYEIITPGNRKCLPPKGYSWRVSREKFDEMVKDNRIWFGEKGVNTPRIKRFLSEVKKGVVSTTLWTYQEVGHNQEAKREIKSLFKDSSVFATPKPEKLIERIITLATEEGDLVMDSFLGSGTTIAVAQKMKRGYIGIEMGDHAKTYCAKRLKDVVNGEQGGISKSNNWKGGSGFRFFKLGNTIFDENGLINDGISFENLSAHIWFSETKTPFNKKENKSTFLGFNDKTGYALLYNGILKDKTVNGGNVLTSKTLKVILEDMNNKPYDKLVVYGESSRIGDSRLKELKVEFKQTPYDIKAR